MSLAVEVTRIDPDITVVRVCGNLTFAATDTLTSRVQHLLDEGAKKLILELSSVEHIDSGGGVSIIRCFFAAKEAAARLCMAGASLCVVQLFKTTQIETLIPSFQTIAGALEHFAVTGKAGGQTS